MKQLNQVQIHRIYNRHYTFPLSPTCIKWAFILPLINYIVNTDTNLINAITNENNNAASNNNLIIVIFLYYQYHRYRVPFRLTVQPLTTLMRQLVQEYPVLIYRPFGLNTAYRWYCVG